MAISELSPKPTQATVAVETCLKIATERLCPECEAIISLKPGTLDGEAMDCPDCGFGLEVAFFNPNDPESVKKIIGMVQKQKISGQKTGYDVSHLDLSKSPALIPEPAEEEDFGE